MRVRFYAEAAQSEFDFDGSGGTDAEQDNAYRFFTQYAPNPIGLGNTPWEWGISLEKIRVEPNFYSLSNQYLTDGKLRSTRRFYCRTRNRKKYNGY